MSLAKKVKNKISCYINLLKLKLYGIKHGRNCVIHGKLNIQLGHKSEITIGNNFYMSSGSNMNPLCANDRGFFCCNKDAKISIGDNVGMSSSRIWAHKSITIGSNVKLGGNVIIMDSDAHSLDCCVRRNSKADMTNKKDCPIVIGDDVFIGMNTIVLKGVTIGARSVIGAGSVVTKSIPADCIAAGNPARIIKKIKNEKGEL